MQILPSLRDKVVKRIDPIEKYAESINILPISCVDVIAYRGNGSADTREILMVQRDEEPAKGFYWPPGGRHFKNEGLVDCARRKLDQECGIKDAKILKQIGTFVASWLVGSVEGVINGYHYHGTDYLAKVGQNDPVVTLDHTSNGYAWMGYDEIQDKHPQGLHPYLFEVLNASNVFGRQFDKYDARYGEPEVYDTL